MRKVHSQEPWGPSKDRGASVAGAVLLAILLGACATAANSVPEPEAPVAGELLALVGGTVYPSPEAAPIEDAVILVRDGVIEAVGERSTMELPPAAEPVDCSGNFVVAGFANSHVHFFERKWARVGELTNGELALQIEQALTRFGFVHAYDLGSDWSNTHALRERIDTGAVAGPSLRTTGSPLIAPGAMPAPLVMAVLGFTPMSAYETADVDAALRATRELLELGVDGIKIHLQRPRGGEPPFPLAAIGDVAAAAQAAGKHVFVHPHDTSDVAAAIAAGVDVIAHTSPASTPWGGEVAKALRARDGAVALTPTLTLWHDSLRHDRVSLQQQRTEQAVEQLRAWIGAGGAVLYGTDLGAVAADPRTEYALMQRAGMDFRAILASLTTTPAHWFDPEARRGRVAPGFAADLVVLAADPARDVGALARVRYTLRAGRMIYRAR